MNYSAELLQGTDELGKTLLFYRLAKHFLVMLFLTAFICLIGLASYIILMIQLYENCHGGVGQQVIIPLAFSYLFYFVFAMSCIHMVLSARNMKWVHLNCFIVLTLKIASIVMTVLRKNRNWGECFISANQGLLILVDNGIECIILIFLYSFSRQVYLRMVKYDLVEKLQLMKIFRA